MLTFMGLTLKDLGLSRFVVIISHLITLQVGLCGCFGLGWGTSRATFAEDHWRLADCGIKDCDNVKAWTQLR